jgi:hypothetical protein
MHTLKLRQRLWQIICLNAAIPALTERSVIQSHLHAFTTVSKFIDYLFKDSLECSAVQSAVSTHQREGILYLHNFQHRHRLAFLEPQFSVIIFK